MDTKMNLITDAIVNDEAFINDYSYVKEHPYLLNRLFSKGSCERKFLDECFNDIKRNIIDFVNKSAGYTLADNNDINIIKVSNKDKSGIFLNAGSPGLFENLELIMLIDEGQNENKELQHKYYDIKDAIRSIVIHNELPDDMKDDIANVLYKYGYIK